MFTSGRGYDMITMRQPTLGWPTAGRAVRGRDHVSTRRRGDPHVSRPAGTAWSSGEVPIGTGAPDPSGSGVQNPTMVLQPIVDIATGTAVAAEALARFGDETRSITEVFESAHAQGHGMELEAACVRAARDL